MGQRHHPVRGRHRQGSLESYHDADSNTYVIRLCRDARVLLFRLSEAQVHTAEREPECEKTLRNRVKEVRRLLGRTE